ncbi:MAG: hypothetical protein HXS44_15325 [Theionarchaea archaeon]|nr:hypothetical protein [Theionarchaea archaeon]
MREIFLTELVCDVLGPGEGIRETLDTSPLNKYITGVLAPIKGNIVTEIDNETEIPMGDTQEYEEDSEDVEITDTEIDNEAEIPMGDTQEYEEDSEDVEITDVPFFSPILDPKRRSPSMGISFLLESEDNPRIRICLSWARYEMKKDDERPAWTRNPRYSLLDLELNPQVIWIDSTGKQIEDQNQAEISLHVITKDEGGNHYFVSLYLVNRVRVSLKKSGRYYATAEEHIFQPQIRVSCLEGTKVAPGRRAFGGGEDRELEFLYRNRQVFARGHMCSAVWRDIDPENMETIPLDLELDFPECLERPPFKWQDSELLSEEERKIFCSSDLRTEFVPIYQILGANFEWQSEYGEPPELLAEILAETWDPEELKKALSPLANGYEKWIREMSREIESDPLLEDYQEITQSLTEKCRTTLQRIRDGIELLCTDDNIRLSFCFCNKANNIQYKWRNKGKELEWYPFQLAFILMTLESIVNPSSRYRKTCDLLWIPTGGGKTEAYLAIAALTMAYRRRRPPRIGSCNAKAGVSVMTRYTLRLLTIQQFRRALALVSACEYLRVQNLGIDERVGWFPREYEDCEGFLWGSTPFSAGLWVGGTVTPNKLRETWINEKKIPGALDILKGELGEGEPAQILNCPACGSVLAVPERGIQRGEHKFYFVFRSQDSSLEDTDLSGKSFRNIEIIDSNITPQRSQNYFTLCLQIRTDRALNAREIDGLWEEIVHFLKEYGQYVEIASARPSRPGYFIRYYISPVKRKKIEYDFEIFCPNPVCPMHIPWCAGAPAGWANGREPHIHTSSECNSLEIPRLSTSILVDIQEPFQFGASCLSDRIPIPALIIDDQVYHRLPSMLVGTVDKFARPPFEPRAAAFFGNVLYHHSIWGYYRPYNHPSQSDSRGHPVPAGYKKSKNYVIITPLPEPPDLILQDELHLIEGPLGSIAGIYETAVDFLSREATNFPIKYIASTATIRNAEEQIVALFLRSSNTFPSNGHTINDKFFMRDHETHPLCDNHAGRLYVGICAPGRGAHTPMINIWARLLQTGYTYRDHPEIDFFWTLTGYFNSIRELAGVMAVYRQDIVERINKISENPRQIEDQNTVEISSRKSSTELPEILDVLSRRFPDSPDALFATSMLGTGVDIPRIGLMVVDGQPKTTSSYIQSTGRVGRRRGALVPIFLRASRPRDLNHYEFFCGYHRQLHRFVEPVTVYPFSPGALDRAAGPVGVFILRNMRNEPAQWYIPDTAPLMIERRNSDTVETLRLIMEERAQCQPSVRRPRLGDVEQHMNIELDRWRTVAEHNQKKLLYVEYTFTDCPKYPVVLGDYYHKHAGIEMVYENTPQSFRNIEETTGFET